MTIAVAACGDRELEEAINLVLSLTMFSNCSFTLHFFVSANATDDATSQLNRLMSANVFLRTAKTLFVHEARYPKTVKNPNEWDAIDAAPFGALKLFLPELLPSTESVLYLDPDSLLVEPVERLWSYFSRMASQQLVALASDHETDRGAWYLVDNPLAKIPFVPPRGVNSGVMLMNLSRMRRVKWTEEMVDMHAKYKALLHRHDQDLINLYFSCHPGRLMMFPCRWNFRPLHCQENACNCESALSEGIALLRGGGSSAKSPHSHTIYSVFYNFDPTEQTFLDGFIEALRDTVLNANQLTTQHCNVLYKRLVENMEKLILTLYPQSFEMDLTHLTMQYPALLQIYGV